MGSAFEYHVAEGWDQAIELLTRFGPEALPLAGGTDVMVLIRRGKIQPRHLVSMDHIPGWNAIRQNGSFSLGAGTTYRQLRMRLAGSGPHAALVEAARQIGGVQVQNVATIGGNLCNASPAADAVPPLLAMGAELTLAGPEGERVVPADRFIVGPGRTVLGQAELLKEITIPELPEKTATVFLKAGRRSGMEISIVSVAVALTVADQGEVCSGVRIALGAVAPTPVRAAEAEEALRGRSLTTGAMEEAANLAVRATDPISDVRASADYRRHLTRLMVRRGLEECLRRVFQRQSP